MEQNLSGRNVATVHRTVAFDLQIPSTMKKGHRRAAFFHGGAEPLPIFLAQGFRSDIRFEFKYGEELSNLRKLPVCQVRVKNPLSQNWLIGKETLQGPRNGR